MCDAAGFLNTWQTLIGAVLGGVISLSAALIVAGSVSRREQRSAARVLIPDLLAVMAKHLGIDEVVAEKSFDQPGAWREEANLWRVRELARHRPFLSPLFDQAFAQVSDIDESLAAHLSLFRSIYGSLERSLERAEQELARIKDQAVSTSQLGELIKDAQVIEAGLPLAARHAECATHLLTELVLGRTPRLWKRLRFKLWPKDIEVTSRQLLATGSLPV